MDLSLALDDLPSFFPCKFAGRGQHARSTFIRLAFDPIPLARKNGQCLMGSMVSPAADRQCQIEGSPGPEVKASYPL